MNINQIYWLSAFLDGEGYFTFNTTPVITISQTDLDLVIRVKEITKASSSIGTSERSKFNSNHKDAYILTISGMTAIQWMMTIYSLMSVRRKAEIRNVIERWKTGRNKQKGATHCKNGHELTDTNTYIQANGAGGAIICRICRKEYKNKLWSKNREANNEKQREYYNRSKNDPVKIIAKFRKISYDEAKKVFEELYKEYVS
jgi:hypothetical protein